jgi:hypothetical protein
MDKEIDIGTNGKGSAKLFPGEKERKRKFQLFLKTLTILSA